MDDLISRQAAIDALKSQLSDWNDDYNIPVRKSIENIERLPSAQSEQCEDAVRREDVQSIAEKSDWFESSDSFNDFMWALYDLPSAQPEQRWIPCSDENPKADGRYLITGKMGTVYSLDFEDGRWYGGIKPVAWMPLPEPYAERWEE